MTWRRLCMIAISCRSVTCVDTSRAAAAIVAVAATCLAGLRVGAAVRTCTGTLQELHVVRTFLVCGNKHFECCYTSDNLTILQNMRHATVQLMSAVQGQTFKWTLTAKGCIPPLLGLATCMDTLSGELGDGFAEDGVSFIFRVAHISLTGFNEGFHIQKTLTVAKRSTAEYLVT